MIHGQWFGRESLEAALRYGIPSSSDSSPIRGSKNVGGARICSGEIMAP
jgi:hypothetical protein